MSSFSRKVRQIRKNAGLTQAEFAAALDVRQSTVSRWESQKFEQMPEVDAMLKVARFADIDPTAFLNWDDSPSHRQSSLGVKIKVIGEIRANLWMESSKLEEEERFEVQIPGLKSWTDYCLDGYVLRDNSVNSFYEKNTIFFITPTTHSEDDRIAVEDRVLVERKNDKGLFEVTIKRFDNWRGKRWLRPLTLEPELQTVLSLDEPPTGGVISTEITGIVVASFAFERLANEILK